MVKCGGKSEAEERGRKRGERRIEITSESEMSERGREGIK